MGIIKQFCFAVYRLHDTSKIHIQFDDHRSGSFANYMSNKNRRRRQMEGNGRPIFSYSTGHKTSRKHKSNQSLDGVDYKCKLEKKNGLKLDRTSLYR